MIIKKMYSGISIVIIALLLSACASTQLVTEWQDKRYLGDQLNRIMVIGAIDNMLYRRTYEDAIVEKFKENGIDAIASYTLISDLKDYDDEEKLKRAVEKTSADGVLVAKLVAYDESEQYIPPSYDISPYVGVGGGYYRSYHSAVFVSYRPGYIKKTTIIRIGSEMFLADSEHLLWAAETKSFNPGSYQNVVNKLAEITLMSLKEKGFVK
jgi:hypothetical protein